MALARDRSQSRRGAASGPLAGALCAVLLGCGASRHSAELDLLPPTPANGIEAALEVPAGARLDVRWTPTGHRTATRENVEVWLQSADAKAVRLSRSEFDNRVTAAGRLAVDLGAHEGHTVLLRVVASSKVAWQRATVSGSAGGPPHEWLPRPRDGAPNVVVLLLDTLRPDVLGAYGGPGPTPNIDRMAREGTTFERAYSTSTWTRPAVASLFSGLTSAAHHVNDDMASMPEQVLSLAERFRLRGYQTVGVVANGHVSANLGFDQGFAIYDLTPLPVPAGDTWDPALVSENVAAGTVHALAVDHLRRARDRARPLFLYLHTVDPHEPYRPPKWLLPDARPELNVNNFLMRSINEGEGASAPLLRDLAAMYRGSVAYADDEVGRMLGALAPFVDLEDTVVVVTSDHGEGFFEHRFVGHRNWPYEELTRIPLIVRGPGVEAGRRDTSPASLIDLVATLTALAGGGGGEPPLQQGVDLLARASATTRGERPVSSEFLELGSVIVADEWKLAYRATHPEPLRASLFNLRLDPFETRDVFEAEPQVAARLEAEIHRLRAEARRLGIPTRRIEHLTPGLEANLRALGYLE